MENQWLSWTLLELFCGHAQLTLEDAKANLNVLEPRDLRFGHDLFNLFQPEEKEKVLNEVERFKPELVWIALPCMVWGPWTNLNYSYIYILRTDHNSFVVYEQNNENSSGWE